MINLNSDLIQKEYQLWSQNNETPRSEHYLQGLNIQQCVNEALFSLETTYAFESSSIGNILFSPSVDFFLIEEIEKLKEIQQTLKIELKPVVQGTIAFDIHAGDHNGGIKNSIRGALKNHTLAITTNSLIKGKGTIKSADLDELRKTIQEEEEHYHYFMDDTQQYVLMIPKNYLPNDSSPFQLLKTLDFDPSTWILVEASDLTNSHYNEASVKRFTELFTTTPQALKRWVVTGHGGKSTLCSLTQQEYAQLYDFFKTQNTQFLYVDSCKAGSKKEWHDENSTIVTILGTFSSEDSYGAPTQEDFFSKLDSILTREKVRSIHPFKKLFWSLDLWRNTKIIKLANDNKVSHPFQLVDPNFGTKDLLNVDIIQAKITSKPIDLSEKIKVCVHPKNVNAPIVVSQCTKIFPYHQSQLTIIDTLMVKEKDNATGYFHFLENCYKEHSEQSATFLFRQLYGKENIVWLLKEDTSYEWELSTIGLKELLTLRQHISEEQLLNEIVPLIPQKTIEHLDLFFTVTSKKGVELTDEETLFFKDFSNECIEKIIKEGNLSETLIKSVQKSKRGSKSLLKYCIQYHKLDLISDLDTFKKRIRKSHFLDALESGNVTTLQRLLSVKEHSFSSDTEFCLLLAAKGGEEMMIEMYKRLDLEPNYPLLPNKSLLQFTIENNWKKLIEVMNSSV